MAAAQTGAVIEARALAKRYGRKGTLAVKGLSLEVPKGHIFGLIGPDGAGKTSIIQILAGVLSASGGAARVDGIDVLRRPEKVKQRIGYMPQGLGQNLYDSLTVRENIAFFRDLRQVPRKRFEENCDRLLGITRLTPFLERPAGKLSGGMRQKLALICTLIHLPDILLLDEPTTGVDPISRRDFWAIINDLVAERGITVLLTTAYMDEAERCQSVALMHRGEVIARGTPETLITRAARPLFAITGDAPERIADALSSGRAADFDITLFGRAVQVALRTGEKPDHGSATTRDHDSGKIRQHLTEAGIQGAEITPVDASLEDVFIQAVRQNGKGEDGGGNRSGKSRAALPRPSPIPAASSKDTETKEKPDPVTAEELTCRFGPFTAVDAVTFSVRAGEIYGLLGPNGAGKTTLIRMLCGLQRPSDGGGRVAGHDIRHDVLGVQKRIGYMSQRFSLYRDLTVAGNLRLQAGLYDLSQGEARWRIDEVLERLDLAAARDRLVSDLPLGVRQRLALASALLHQPPVLFLDEPTSGVDPLARRSFWNIVHNLAEKDGVTTLVSTHYMDEAEHCHRLGLMQAGRLIASDTPETLKQQAEDERGRLVVVRADNFTEAYQRLRKTFPRAMFYGRRIQWQSADAETDAERAKSLLQEAAIDASAEIIGLSIEETFVSFMESSHA